VTAIHSRPLKFRADILYLMDRNAAITGTTAADCCRLYVLNLQSSSNLDETQPANIRRFYVALVVLSDTYRCNFALS